jgi:hypothetical protein
MKEDVDYLDNMNKDLHLEKSELEKNIFELKVNLREY